MKVLLTHELFYPDFAGGGEKLAYEIARNLIKKGVDVKVLTTGNPKIKEYKGIKTFRMPINRYLMNFAFFSVMKHAKDADLIQTCNYNACFSSWLAAKILKKPIVCVAFGLYGKRWIKIRGLLKGIISMIVERIQLNRSYNKVILLSDYSRDWALEIGIPKKRTKVINPGVDLGNFKPSKKEKFVLFSGRFANQKGVYDIIKVAKKLHHIKFVLMGWGEEEKKLRKIAPSNVKFSNLSFKNGKPFFDMYSKALIFFLPSYGEGFGFVLAEAMASGCAVVSTVPLGYKGYVVKPGNINEMAKRISFLEKNPSIAKKMGKRNVKISKNFNWNHFTKNLIGLYKSILSKK